MKKKLLSLVLAGAMVASTSVSAFAATTTPADTTTEKKTISEIEDETDVNVTVKGDILDEKGNAQQGTISVTVPTAVNFTVTKDGRLASGDMVITNHSSEKLKVSVKQFKDSDADDNISIIKKSEFNTTGAENVERNKIWLNLVGEGTSVGFESAGNGKVHDVNNYSPVSPTEALWKIGASGTLSLKLVGAGGKQNNPLATPVKDTFNLMLTIARDRQN